MNTAKAGERGCQTLINEAWKQAIQAESLEGFVRKTIREEMRRTWALPAPQRRCGHDRSLTTLARVPLLIIDDLEVARRLVFERNRRPRSQFAAMICLCPA